LKKIVCFFFLFFLFFFFFQSFLFPSIGKAIKAIKVLKINSVKQKIENLNKIVFEENVEILVDRSLHIWADRVEVNKDDQTLMAQKGPSGCVKIEDNDFLILADSFFLDLNKKSGRATNIKLHFEEGFVSGKSAKKFGQNWQLEDIVFTPCDKTPPHWSITAKKAKLYGNYLLKTSGIILKAGSSPFFVWPYLALPIQGRSRSGFLLPKFSFDDELGLGVKEEFYWFIASRCDSTIGFDWRDRKGFVFSDEFRWVRSPNSFTEINSQYAIEKNALLQKKNEVIKGTNRRYWVEGKDFRPMPIVFFDSNIHSLTRVDFGTDKRIGFHFLNEAEEVEDTFYNSWIFRWASQQKLIDFSFFDSSKSWRKRFSDMSDEEIKKILGPLAFDEREKLRKGLFSGKKELEDRIEVWKMPHLECNSVYQRLLDFFSYRYDFFVDRINSRQRITEKAYLNSKVVKEDRVLPLDKTDSLRMFYKANLQRTIRVKDQLFRLYVEPSFQLRSKIKENSKKLVSQNCLEGKFLNEGAYRIFAQMGAQWAFPEYFSFGELKTPLKDSNSQDSNFSTYNYMHYFQPTINWDFVPKIKQDRWYWVDRYDRVFPKNRLEFCVRSNWYFENIGIDLNLSQGFDFYNRSDFFQLNRVTNQKHLLPFCVDFGITCNKLDVFLSHEYDLRDFKLLQSQIDIVFPVGKFNFSLGLLYQDLKLQKEREVISDIPHFAFFNIDVPITKQTTFSYTGHFYSQKGNTVLPLEGIKPLLHKVYLNYEGHCWGINLGFEEKNFRQVGNWKSERAFVINFKLDSLGSFARKFKKPIMSREGVV